ncbi:MAG: hypothetical protein N2647_05520 [Thermodesulfovibrio sp.]|nr:hypothetical protein [Thermodesulfovibrio sp.]
MEKFTGYTACGDNLYVGDILAFHSGYMGFFKVIEKNGQYWVVDAWKEVFGHEISDDDKIEDFPLTHNLDGHWSKRDKNNPIKEPPFPVQCDRCSMEIGTFDVDTGVFAWNENCAKHSEIKTDMGYVVKAFCVKCKLENNIKT